MSTLEDRLNDLEEALSIADTELKIEDSSKKSSDTIYSYVNIMRVLIPLLTISLLYFASPQFITKTVKGKKVICYKMLLLYTFIISLIGWFIIYGLQLYNYF